MSCRLLGYWSASHHTGPLVLRDPETEEMQSFITANNIDVKNEDDPIRLLNYYNSI
jgi:hypothetical protein